METRVQRFHSKKRGFRWLLSNAYLLILLCLIILSVGIKTTKIDSYFGYHFRVVLSNSMAPKMASGSLLLTKEVTIEEVKEKEIVVAKIDDDYVTHRIIGFEGVGKSRVLITKGDNNDFVDSTSVSTKELQERVVVTFPHIGNILLTVQTPRGAFAFLCLILFIFLLDNFIQLLIAVKKEQSENVT